MPNKDGKQTFGSLILGILVCWNQRWPYLNGETCHIVKKPSFTIIYKMNIMLCWGRLEARDIGHELIGKLFTDFLVGWRPSSHRQTFKMWSNYQHGSIHTEVSERNMLFFIIYMNNSLNLIISFRQCQNRCFFSFLAFFCEKHDYQTMLNRFMMTTCEHLFL